MTTDEKAMAYTARICNQAGVFTKGEVETAFVTGYNEATQAFEKEYGWHDLSENPCDLPNDGDYVICRLPLGEEDDADSLVSVLLYCDGQFEDLRESEDALVLWGERTFSWKRID